MFLCHAWSYSVTKSLMNSGNKWKRFGCGVWVFSLDVCVDVTVFRSSQTLSSDTCTHWPSLSGSDVFLVVVVWTLSLWWVAGGYYVVFKGLCVFHILKAFWTFFTLKLLSVWERLFLLFLKCLFLWTDVGNCKVSDIKEDTRTIQSLSEGFNASMSDVVDSFCFELPSSTLFIYRIFNTKEANELPS